VSEAAWRPAELGCHLIAGYILYAESAWIVLHDETNLKCCRKAESRPWNEYAPDQQVSKRNIRLL
jgi:hypothetical protein